MAVATALGYPDDMTLGEAVELLRDPGWGCCCVGPQPGRPACPCRLAFDQARALQRAAHIAARQF